MLTVLGLVLGNQTVADLGGPPVSGSNILALSKSLAGRRPQSS